MSDQPVPDVGGTCTLCRTALPKTEMVEIEGKWVCAACKESFVQSIKEGISLADLTIARSKKVLVMGRNALLPDRCVKCNSPSSGQRLKRKLYWHSPVLYLLLFVNILIYALVAILVRKKAAIEVGLCDRHFAKRRVAIGVSWVLFLASVILIVTLGFVGSGEYAIMGIVLLIVVIIYAAIATRVVSARRIDKEYVWLNGVSREYLDTLPEWVKQG